MTSSPFANMLGLSEDEAIALLDSDDIGEGNSRYAAAAHLINFSSDRTIQALIRAIQKTDESLDNRIVRRKAVESLGRIKNKAALPVIRSCLSEADCYTVENAVWAIGEIGTDDADILEEIAQLLAKPTQTYRVLIQTLAKLGYQPATERIKPFTKHAEGPIASAAIAAVSRLSGNDTLMAEILPFLEHENVYTRRLCIQDLMDAGYVPGIPSIVKAPVSVVFRLRGLRALYQRAIAEGALAFTDAKPSLKTVLRDHPSTLEMVHEYDQPPSLEFLIRELYETDFGRCYLATQTLLEHHTDTAALALLETYRSEAYNDYGANYHVIKTLGWLQYPAYDLFIEALHRSEPQFQKSRIAAAIALGESGFPGAIAELKISVASPIWELKYASLIALEQLDAEDSWENEWRELEEKL